MKARLLDSASRGLEPTWEEIEARSRAGGFYWLDVEVPSEVEVDRLGELYGFHELALDDAKRFEQRPKVTPYDDMTQIIAFGADVNGEPIEVHFFYRLDAMVTIRRRSCPPLDALFDSSAFQQDLGRAPILVLHELLESLVVSFDPVVDDIDEHLTSLEAVIFEAPTPERLAEIMAVKRRLAHMRHSSLPLRDQLAGATTLLSERLPGMSREGERYFRDLYDLLVHLAEHLDSERDHASEVMDVYLSMVNNRQNDVMKQLTVVATIFLPLTFVTGFFGMNFPSLIRHLNGWLPFLVWGIGLDVASILILLWFLRRRAWL
jgi:magnesium transporter